MLQLDSCMACIVHRVTRPAAMRREPVLVTGTHTCLIAATSLPVSILKDLFHNVHTKHIISSYTLLALLISFKLAQACYSCCLAKPSVYTSLGRHAFSYAAPQIWNAIPVNIRNSPSVSSFKRNFKNILFCCSLLIF